MVSRRSGRAPLFIGSLYHLRQEVFINALQEPLGFLMSCCVASPGNTKIVEVLQEHQGLQI